MKKTQVTQVPEKAKKGLFRIIFSRTGIILLLILMQIGLVVGTTYYLEAYKDFIYGIFVLMRVVVLIYIINDSGMPEFTMAWLLFVILTPLIGTIFFIYVKMQPGTKFLRSRQAALKIETDEYIVFPNGSGPGCGRCYLGKQISKCKFVVLFIPSVRFPDLSEYRGEIFSIGRI